MQIRLNPRWLLVSTLLCSLQFCRAQVVVPPTLSFDLGSEDIPETQLWDLNGGYAVHLLVTGKNGVAVPVEVDFTLVQSPSGKLTTTSNDLANASVVFNDDVQSAFACVAKVSGKVTGFGGTARAHFTVRFVGNGQLGGQSTPIQGTLTVDAETGLAPGQLIGGKLSKFSATMPGLNTITGKSDFVADLPSGSDGSWNLTVNLVGVQKLTGTAVVATPSESLGLDLTGKFKNGLVIAKAKGAGDVPNTVNGEGASGTILIPPSFDTIQFNGKLLGQKMSFNVTTATE